LVCVSTSQRIGFSTTLKPMSRSREWNSSTVA
jgi:hypothetical protein